MRTLRYICAAAVAAAALGLSGCASRTLQPAAGVQTLPGDPQAAVGEAAGVRMVVRANAWKADPSDLKDVMTPIRATIENRSGRPLQIRYSDFQLVSDSGFRHNAIPPYQINASISRVTPVSARFGYDAFWVSPYYSGFYGPYLRPWGGYWAYDPWYYGTYYQVWREPLPTEDMLELAIPEGVLDSGGRLNGFLYFQKVSGDTKAVTFRAGLVDAFGQGQFGSINIPFVVATK